ncbi:DUF3891 family protein [Sporosarcina sp. P33]|uniref:DUF3891 family protein n=1 Tax=Sporosarcina sp. P33 TaxID=1930764 RepID=UPI0009BE07B9|nr:DUF3891 family protein [Sporosarcina sp. P33]ARD47394.1 hypothetical protein SporoP33_03415 [Sporosarcina sp. P33]
MIVREHDKSFSLVAQHHHGQLAGYLMQFWREDMFPDDKWRNSVLTAITNHDIGWHSFDEQPFWNDAKDVPFGFTDFPLLPKILLYRSGIDRVEKIDAYAAMLCSVHYEQFIEGSGEKEAREFIHDERLRRERLSEKIEGFDAVLFEKHFALLQLGDNFSLYCCLNDPGADKMNEHPFFQQGIPSPFIFPSLPKEKIGIRYTDPHTIRIEEFPFRETFDVKVKQKTVLKKDIADQGFQSAYAHAMYETITLRIAAEDK